MSDVTTRPRVYVDEFGAEHTREPNEAVSDPRVTAWPVGRVIVAVCIVVVALVATPAALVPVFNSADLLVIAAPFALVATLMPRRAS